MIDKTIEITSMEQSQIPMLNSILDEICTKAMAVRYTSILPTSETVREGEFVIYDNGSGTKQIYVITGKKNLGSITLT